MMPTALIVEDEVEANLLLAQLVRLRGCDTESAYTGGEALAIADTRPPDLIFLDLMLPDTNGFELCRALKSRRQTALIPVVVVTARVADENRLESFRHGAAEFISKPYTPNEIFEALEAAQSWRKAVAEQPPTGEIRLRTGSDVGVFEAIGRLQGLLLARTRWDERQIWEFGNDLVSAAQNLLDWARRHGVTEPAALGYAVYPHRFELTLVDLTRSAGNPPLPTSDALALLAPPGRFDSVGSGASGREVTLTKQFRPYER